MRVVFQVYEFTGDHKTTLVLKYRNLVFLFNPGPICDPAAVIIFLFDVKQKFVCLDLLRRLMLDLIFCF